MKIKKSVILIIAVFLLSFGFYINNFYFRDMPEASIALTSDIKIDNNIYDIDICEKNAATKIMGENEEDWLISASKKRMDLHLPLSNIRPVIIDAGHGGSDPGALNGNIFEKDIVLDVAKRVNSLLLNIGINTFLTRETDTFVDVADRIKFANQANGILFVSIHCDSDPNTTYNGTHTLYCSTYNPTIGKLNKKAADIIQSELSKRLETANRGIFDINNLQVLKYTDMPSVLIELAFISNESDKNALTNEKFKEKAAVAIAKGIRQALKKII